MSDCVVVYVRFSNCSLANDPSFAVLLPPLTALKVEKGESGSVDYNSMRVKQLKTLLDQRGVRCSGCTEKSDYVKKCQETEHLDL